MASGYYQIPLHADSVECTAFVTPDGQYEFLAMPFGLKNASSVFQYTVMQALGLASYFRQFVQGFSCFMKPLYLLTSERNEFI